MAQCLKSLAALAEDWVWIPLPSTHTASHNHLFLFRPSQVWGTYTVHIHTYTHAYIHTYMHTHILLHTYLLILFVVVTLGSFRVNILNWNCTSELILISGLQGVVHPIRGCLMWDPLQFLTSLTGKGKLEKRVCRARKRRESLIATWWASWSQVP